MCSLKILSSDVLQVWWHHYKQWWWLEGMSYHGAPQHSNRMINWSHSRLWSNHESSACCYIYTIALASAGDTNTKFHYIQGISLTICVLNLLTSSRYRGCELADLHGFNFYFTTYPFTHNWSDPVFNIFHLYSYLEAKTTISVRARVIISLQIRIQGIRILGLRVTDLWLAES